MSTLLLLMREKADKRQKLVLAIPDSALRAELLRRAEKDQAVRGELVRHGITHPDKEAQARMAAVALVTNVLLPYGLGNFRLIHVGTLSTVLFLGAVGYAVFAYHLFRIRVIVRATFVLAGLLALALELYSLALSFLAHLLPLGSPEERSFAATALVLVVNAFTQEPVRRWLGRLIDRAYYGHHPSPARAKPRRPMPAH